MDPANLNSFLKFGYFLDYKHPWLSFDFSEAKNNYYEAFNESELIRIGINLWKEVISEQFNCNEKHVVPLSGGIDSRAILGSLLEHTEAKNIHTYTFGTPGTYDFAIGNRIAKITGTQHCEFPLTKYTYSTNELIEISKRIDHQTLLFLHAPVWELDKRFYDFSVWSGTIIDVFFGRHNHKNIAGNLHDAMENSFNENLYVRSIELSTGDNSQYHKFINYDPKTEGYLDYEHTIDLLNRQLKFIAPHVLMKGFRYNTLLNKKLIDFAISIKKEYLVDQNLYKKMFLYGFPHLFSYPVKSNSALPLKTNMLFKSLRKAEIKSKKMINKYYPLFLNPNINYIDFNNGIRDRNDIKKVVYENIMDLKNRKIINWVDIEGIWKRHIQKQKDHSDALLVLASLEIHLKAGLKL